MYTDGQKIAKRLSAGISKETRKAKELLEDYNATCAQIDDSYCPTLLADLLQTDSTFWKSVCNSEDEVPWDTKQSIIQAYLLMKRSKEELKLLRGDMQNIIAYWSNRIVSISVTIEQLHKLSDKFSIGAISSLKQLLWEATLQHSRAADTFGYMKEGTSSFDYDSDSDSEASNSDYNDDL